MSEKKESKINYFYKFWSGVSKNIQNQSIIISDEENKMESKVDVEDQDESHSESRVIDIKGLCDKKTIADIQEKLQEELTGVEWHKVEEEKTMQNTRFI